MHIKGGDGSGNYDHAGRIGVQGGSAPSGRRKGKQGVSRDNYTGTPRVARPDSKEEVAASARGVKNSLAKQILKELSSKGGKSYIKLLSVSSNGVTTKIRQTVNYLVRKALVILSEDSYGEKGQSISLTNKGRGVVRELS